jgi:hypothetical protein
MFLVLNLPALIDINGSPDTSLQRQAFKKYNCITATV